MLQKCTLVDIEYGGEDGQNKTKFTFGIINFALTFGKFIIYWNLFY